MFKPIAMATLLLLILVGCSQSLEQRLVGTWGEAGVEGSLIAFAADGTLRQESYGTTYTANWRVVDEATVEVTFTGESVRLGTTNLRISFNDDGMTTANSVGRSQSWQRR